MSKKINQLIYTQQAKRETNRVAPLRARLVYIVAQNNVFEDFTALVQNIYIYIIHSLYIWGESSCSVWPLAKYGVGWWVYIWWQYT